MADYEILLKVKVLNIEDDNDYFHEDTMDFLIETGIIDDSIIEKISKING